MRDWLAEQASVRGDALALSVSGINLSFHDLDAAVSRCCGWLVQCGIEEGNRLAILSPPSLDYVCVIYACVRLGLVLVPLNIRLSVDELSWQILSSDVFCVLVAGGGKLLSSRVKCVDLMAWRFFGGNDYTNTHLLKNLDDPQSIIFTSGTSGRPKGAVITYGNQLWSAMASAYRVGVLPNDRWLCCLPLYHVGGMAVIMRSCLYGTAVILHDGFDIAAVQQAFDTQSITLISLVPTMLYRMIEAEVRFPPTLRLILLGGAAASPDLLEGCRALNLPVAPTYGLSEACSQVATMLPSDAYRKPGSVGKPLLFTHVRIADASGASLPPGAYGEIVVSGPTVMAGYYNDPDASAKTMRGDELYTGDIGYLDDDGDLWVVQRRSDLIVSGGENVYPAEVERVLQEHPSVEAVCVVGVDHPEWGQQVAAAVVLRENAILSASELIAFSRQHLASYKQPREIRFVDALPQTASGKIHRRAVVELFNKP